MAPCGSDRATLKADADQGQATLSIDGEEYTHRNGTIFDSGDPHIEEGITAHLFAFLTKTRRYISTNDCSHVYR